MLITAHNVFPKTALINLPGLSPNIFFSRDFLIAFIVADAKSTGEGKINCFIQNTQSF